MEKPFSRKDLVIRLLRHGVAPRYAWRAATELAEHAEDISEGGARTRLGDLDELADGIVQAYRQRTFAGRHPVFAFVVAPLPLILLAVIAYWVAGVLLLYASTKVTEIAGFVGLGVQFGSFFLPSMLITALVCHLGRRAGLSWQKTAFACVPIVLFSFIVSTSMEITGPTHGRFMIGFCLPFGHLLHPCFSPRRGPRRR